jgi:Flp pilus assembly protein TadG
LLIRRLRGDDGTGLVGMMAGFLVFLLFLFFAMQLLLRLYTTSVATGAAFDAAHLLAGRNGQQMADQGAMQAEAERLVRAQTGNTLFDAAGVVPQTDPAYEPGFVTYRVQVRPPVFLDAPGDFWLTRPIVRTARVRIERVQ